MAGRVTHTSHFVAHGFSDASVVRFAVSRAKPLAGICAMLLLASGRRWPVWTDLPEDVSMGCTTSHSMIRSELQFVWSTNYVAFVLAYALVAWAFTNVFS